MTIVAAIVMAACGAESAPTELVPTQAPLPTATMPPIPTPVPTALPPTVTPVPSPTPVPPTPTATATPAPAPSPTATPEPTLTPPLGPEIEAAAAMGDCEFFLEVANSAEERAVGLMGRESMGRDRGMLFVFSAEQVLGFWMKNTLIPLDIIFIDSDLSVVDVQTMRLSMRSRRTRCPPTIPRLRPSTPSRSTRALPPECGIEPGITVELRNLTQGVLQ